MYYIKQYFWIKPPKSYPTYREMILIRNKMNEKKNLINVYEQITINTRVY